MNEIMHGSRVGDIEPTAETMPASELIRQLVDHQGAAIRYRGGPEEIAGNQEYICVETDNLTIWLQVDTATGTVYRATVQDGGWYTKPAPSPSDEIGNESKPALPRLMSAQELEELVDPNRYVIDGSDPDKNGAIILAHALAKDSGSSLTEYDSENLRIRAEQSEQHGPTKYTIQFSKNDGEGLSLERRLRDEYMQGVYTNC